MACLCLNKVEFYDGTGFYHVRRGKMIKVREGLLYANHDSLCEIVMGPVEEYVVCLLGALHRLA